MNVEVLQTDQKKKTPVNNGPKTAPYFFRFGLDRSRDTQKSNQSGQDCISVQWTATRLSATLCDGVSQSFFGELAAAELSNKLSQFMLALPNESDPHFLHDTIRAFLDNLSSTFSRTVEEHSLEDVEPAFLRAVLEKKRYLGSEAVFTSVLLDKTTSLMLLVWAGDCRLRLWLRGEEVTRELLSTETFLTQERWSSSRGVIGNLHLALFPFSSFDTIVSYSDGLALLDEKTNIFQESNVALEHYVSQTKSLASSDDVSFLQISTLPTEMIHQGLIAQLPELRVVEQATSDRVQFQWQNFPRVQSWEVVANSETGFVKLTTSKNVVKVPKSEIPPDGAWLAYRAKTSSGFSTWSSWKFYQPPRTSKSDATGSSTPNAFLLPTQRQLPGYLPLPVTNSTYPAGASVQKMPSYNGSTDRYPIYGGTTYTPAAGLHSDRRWQYALLALLMGVVVMGSFLIFGDQGGNPPTLPPPGVVIVTNAPELIIETTVAPTVIETTAPPTIIETTAPPTIIETTAPPTIIETTVPPTIIETTAPPTIIETTVSPTVSESEIPYIFSGLNQIESVDRFIVDDTFLSRPFFRSEVVSP